jgi:hypothetical protein
MFLLYKFQRASVYESNDRTRDDTEDSNQNNPFYVDEKVWECLKTRAQQCHKTQERCDNILQDVRRMCDQLFTESIDWNLNHSNSTFWSAPDTLIFAPKRINYENIDDEQRYSFVVMQQLQKYSNINIVIDLKDITTKFLLENAKSIEIRQIHNGFALWKSLNHRIVSIKIIRPSNMTLFPLLFRMFAFSLSSKIRQRIKLVV